MISVKNRITAEFWNCGGRGPRTAIVGDEQGFDGVWQAKFEPLPRHLKSKRDTESEDESKEDQAEA